MEARIAQSTVVATIVHLSDIHFGFSGPDPVWATLFETVCRLNPSAILITGDIVNTPKKGQFEVSQNELTRLASATPAPIFLCPGNHDRHFFGNALGSWQPWFSRDFFYYLKDWFVEAPRYSIIDLGPRITARVTAIDSSDKAAFFARSLVDNKTRRDLAAAVAAKQDSKEIGKLNLRIVLTHHHLLPIPLLEPKRDGLLGPFQKATTMTVNSGTVLKTLAKAHVDIVLHGHEHKRNVARYTTIENRLGNVTIIGAGSSTGTVTGKGWYLKRATFNVLEIHENDSIWLATYHGTLAKRFLPLRRDKLFDSQDLRRARFYLDYKNIDEAQKQEVKLHFRFLDDRDVIVRRTYSNPPISKENTFRFIVYSDTGSPADPAAWIISESGERVELDLGCGFEVDSNKTYAWRCVATIPELLRGAPVKRLVTAYRWKKAGMLSKAQVDELLPPPSRGPLYTEYLEHAFFAIPPNMVAASLEMSVDLPWLWSPDDVPGSVMCFSETKGQTPERSIALTDTIYSSGDGHYSIRIDYPDPGTRYYLAWRLRAEPRE